MKKEKLLNAVNEAFDKLGDNVELFMIARSQCKDGKFESHTIFPNPGDDNDKEQNEVIADLSYMFISHLSRGAQDEEAEQEFSTIFPAFAETAAFMFRFNNDFAELFQSALTYFEEKRGKL